MQLHRRLIRILNVEPFLGDAPLQRRQRLEAVADPDSCRFGAVVLLAEAGVGKMISIRLDRQIRCDVETDTCAEMRQDTTAQRLVRGGSDCRPC